MLRRIENNTEHLSPIDITEISTRFPMPATLVVQEMQMSQLGTGTTTHGFSSNFNEAICASEKKYETQRSSETLPQLPDEPGQFSWYDRFRPVHFFNELLSLAKNKLTAKNITQYDLDKVIDYCDYKGWVFYVDTEELAQVCFKILVHLAENGWKLPDRAIEVVALEVQKECVHTLNYAMLALAHLIIHGQHPKTTPLPLLNTGIKKLLQLNPEQYLESIIIAIAAKTALDDSLNTNELHLLQRALLTFNESQLPEFKHAPISLAVIPEESCISRWEWYSSLSKLTKLKLIRDYAESQQLLSKAELKYAIRQWHKSTSNFTRICILDIFRYSIINGQRQFPSELEKKVITILDMGITDRDIDLRQLAMLVTNHLLFNKMLNQFPFIQQNLNKALAFQRKFALKSYCHLLNSHGKHFSNVPTLTAFFDTLKTRKYLNQKSQDIIKFIIYSLDEKNDNLEDLIFNPTYCIEVTNYIAISAKNKKLLSTEIIEKLFLIIKRDFHESAQINVLTAFKYIAINNQKIPREFITYFFTKYLKGNNYIASNLVLNILANSVKQHRRFIKKNFSIELLQSLSQAELFTNIIFMYACLVEVSTHLEKYKSFNFIALFLIAFLFNNCTNSQRHLIILLLGKCQEKGLIYNIEAINKLIKAIDFFPGENTDRLRILHIVGKSLQNLSLIKSNDAFYEAILKLCHSIEENEKFDAAQVLEIYIRNSDFLPKQKIITEIEFLILNKLNIHISCKLIKALRNREYLISDELLNFMMDKHNPNSVEESIVIIETLHFISKYQPLPLVLIKKIVFSLENHSGTILEASMGIVEAQLLYFTDSLTDFFNTNVAYLQLLKIAKSYEFNFNTKVRAQKILLCLSEKRSTNFSVEFFSELKPLLSHDDAKLQKTSLKIIQNKIHNMQKLIFNKNLVISDLCTEISKIIYQEKHQKLAIHVLRDAVMAGYIFDKEPAEKLMSKLAQLLYIETEISTRSYICYLLQKHTNSLSSKTNAIYRIELMAQRLNITEEFHPTINGLIIKVQQHEQLTFGVFSALQNIIRLQEIALFAAVIALCDAIQKEGYLIPSDLLTLISQCAAENSDQDFFPDFVRIIAVAIIKKQSAAYQDYLNIEHLLHYDNLDEDTLIPAFEAMQIAINREFVIQELTIYKLLTYSKHENIKVSLPAFQILSKLFKLDSAAFYCNPEPFGLRRSDSSVSKPLHQDFETELSLLLSPNGACGNSKNCGIEFKERKITDGNLSVVHKIITRQNEAFIKTLESKKQEKMKDSEELEEPYSILKLEDLLLCKTNEDLVAALAGISEDILEDFFISASTDEGTKEKIYIKLIDYFFISQDVSYQLALLSAISNYLYTAKNQITPDFLYSLQKFSIIFIKEEPSFLNVMWGWLSSKPIIPEINYHPEIIRSTATLFCHLLLHTDDLHDFFDENLAISLTEAVFERGFDESYLLYASDCSYIEQINLLLTLLSMDFSIKLTPCTFHCFPEENINDLLCLQLITLYETQEEKFTQEHKRTIYSFSKLHTQKQRIAVFLYGLILNKKSDNLTIIKLLETLEMFRQLELFAQPKLRPEEIRHLWLINLLRKYSDDMPAEKVSYLDKLFTDLNWDILLIQQFFASLKPEDSLENIQSFLVVCKKCSLSSDDIFSFNLNKSPLKNLEDAILKNRLKDEIYSFIKKCNVDNLEHHFDLIYRKIKTLLNANWDPHRFAMLFKQMSLETTISPQKVYAFLVVACRYKEVLNENHFYSLYEDNNDGWDFDKILHEHIMNQLFQSPIQERSLSELLEKLKMGYEDKKITTESIESLSIQKFFDDLTFAYNAKTDFILHKQTLKIHAWSKRDISTWAKNFKQYRITNHLNYEQIIENLPLLAEIFAVIKRACVLQFSYEPRIVQLLALFLLIHSKHIKRGILAEIATGEGKSLIIAMLSILKVLSGKYVDIITSSPILAERDQVFFAGFYSLFLINSASNIDSDYKTGVKTCYENTVQIIYGDINNFQFDLLNHEYSQLNTRGERPFHAAIIDEVDNLLIDEGLKIAMLSNIMPGMNELRYLLTLIWLQLKTLDTLRLNPMQNYGENLNPFYPIYQMNISPEEKSTKMMEKIKDALESYIDTVLLNPALGLKTPKHLSGFIQKQKKKWVENAMIAFYIYAKEKHYEIKINRQGIESITPIDFSNTGLLQQGTLWGDGLTQFLQIKHGLKVTPENITTNFLSNVAFIRRYKHDITGISGTLGSSESLKLLNDIYFGIDFLKIPTFLPNRLVELPIELALDEDEWIQAISASALFEANQGRACLVICETIADARKLQAYLKDKFTGHYYYYADNLKDHDYFFEKLLRPNSIIISTNLAGRGTDIKIANEVILNGGLHVCLTFLPANLRVELQAFGRGNRRGEPGTAQLILNKKTLKYRLPNATEQDLAKLEKDVSLIKVLRNAEEKLALAKLQKKELAVNDLKDDLFVEYLQLLKMIEDIDSKKEEHWLPAHDISATAIVQQQFDLNNRYYKRQALEEAWGFWLKEVDFSQSPERIKPLFQIFKKDILQQYEENTIIKNPIYFTKLGNALLDCANKYTYRLYQTEFFKKAIFAYDEAIKSDPHYAINAIYHKAFALVKLAETDYKQKVKAIQEELLTRLEELIRQEQATLQLVLNDASQSLEFRSHGHHAQVQGHIQVYQLFAHAIFNSIQQINQSLKLIDIQLKSPQQEIHHHHLLADQAIMAISLHSGQTNVSFNHLKTHIDLWESSQLRNTLEKVPRRKLINLSLDSRKLINQTRCKEVLLKWLPMNRYRQLLQQTIATFEQQEDMDDPETAGILDKLYATGMQAYQAGGKLFGAISNTINTVVINPLNKLQENIQDIYYNYSEIEQLTPCLEFCFSDLKKLHPLVTACLNFVESSYGFSITMPPIALIQFLREKNHTFSLQHLTNKNINCQIYHEISVTEFEEYLLEGDTSFSKLQLTGSLDQIVLMLNELYTPLGQTYLRACPMQTIFEFKVKKLAQVNAEFLIETFDFDMTISYEGLTKKQAMSFLYLDTDECEQMVMTIEDLDPIQAIQLIKKADRSEQNLNPKHKAINDELVTINNDKLFCNDFAINGFFYLYELAEINPFPWKSMVLLLAASAAQIAGGIALSTLSMGLGASMGITMITEGFNDALRAATTAYTRQFSFQDYLTQKVICLSLSLGMTGILHAFSSSAQALNTAMEYGDEVINSARLISKATTDISTHGIKEALKQSTISLAENIAAEAATIGIHKSANFLLETSRPAVMDNMTKEMKILFANQRWQQILIRVFAVDKFIGNNEEKTFLFAMENTIESIIDKLNFSIPNLKLIDDCGVAKFQTQFHAYLSEIDEHISNFDKILAYKFPEIETKHIERICHLLRANDIPAKNDINLDTLIDFHSNMVRNESDRHTFNPAHYDIENYYLDDLPWDGDLLGYRKPVIAACLSYKALLQDDYYYYYLKFTQKTVNFFTKHIMSALGVVADVGGELLSAGVSLGITQISGSLQETAASQPKNTDTIVTEPATSPLSKEHLAQTEPYYGSRRKPKGGEPPHHPSSSPPQSNRGGGRQAQGTQHPHSPPSTPEKHHHGRRHQPRDGQQPHSESPRPTPRNHGRGQQRSGTQYPQSASPSHVQPDHPQIPSPRLDPSNRSRGRGTPSSQNLPLDSPILIPGSEGSAQSPRRRPANRGKSREAQRPHARLPESSQPNFGPSQSAVETPHLKSKPSNPTPSLPDVHKSSKNSSFIHENTLFYKKPKSIPNWASGIVSELIISIAHLSIKEIELHLDTIEKENQLSAYQIKMEKLVQELMQLDAEEDALVTAEILEKKTMQQERILLDLEHLQNKLHTEIKIIHRMFEKIDEYTATQAFQLMINNAALMQSLDTSPSFIPDISLHDFSKFENISLKSNSLFKEKKPNKPIEQLFNALENRSLGINKIVSGYYETKKKRLAMESELSEIETNASVLKTLEQYKTRQHKRKCVIEAANSDLSTNDAMHQLTKYYQILSRNKAIEINLIHSAIEQKKTELLVIRQFDTMDELSNISTPAKIGLGNGS